jgi:two-component system chemotaxis response regulator CheB
MPIRVLIVDDSAFIRVVFRDILTKDKDIEVIGVARDGYEAVEKVVELNPDVVTLDIEMPKLNGLEALKLIMKKHPVPVVMASTLTQEGAKETITALSIGAVDFVPKPTKGTMKNIRSIEEELLLKVKAAAKSNLKTVKMESPKYSIVKSKPTPLKKTFNKLVLIASSTGGPKALEYVIPKLDGSKPMAVLLVQHMPPKFTASLADRLDKISSLKVVEAKEGEPIISGHCYVAPGDFHMEIKDYDGTPIITLNKKDKLWGVRPSADILFESVANYYKNPLIATILTGMGKDGSKHILNVKKNNSQNVVITQSKETCVVYGMPKSVDATGATDYSLPLDQIANKINSLI